jgi:4-hydroxy-tetrahydrodipicolinate synthase
MLRQGMLIPLVTPLDGAGQVSRKDLIRLLALSDGVASGYIPCLTSGEGWKLTRQQWESMVRFTVAEAPGKTVVAGIERATTEEVLRYAARAKELGAHGVMLTAPFGADVDQRSIFDHYCKVHDSIDLDVYIYHESALCGNETTFATLLAIAQLPRVVGIKDSSDPPCNAEQITALRNHGLAYYTGLEQHLGRHELADGSVVALANLEPALCAAALGTRDLAVKTRIEHMIEQHQLFAADWYRHVKKALKARGIIESDAIVPELAAG